LSLRRTASPTTIESESILSALQSVLGYAKGSLLDVGCGEMPYRYLFESSVSRYVGIDRNGSEGSRNIIGDACHLPIKSASFDTLLSTQVLEHLPEPEIFFREANRALRLGGHLILTAPQAWEVHEAPHDYYRYTRYGLRHLAEKAGFRVMVLQPRGGFFALLGQMLITQLRMQNGLVEKVAQRVIARVFKFLDRRNPMKDDTVGYVMVAKKEGAASGSPIHSEPGFPSPCRGEEASFQDNTVSREKSIDYSFSDLSLKKAQKILVIRSSRMWHIHSIARSLKRSFAGAQISILAQPSAEKELRKEGGVENIFIYGGSNFNAFKIGLGLIREIRSEKFDLCVVPYNNPYGQGYFHVHLIALLSGARYKVSCDKESRVKKLSVWRLSGLSQIIHAFVDGVLLIGVIGLIVPSAVLVAKLWRRRDN